MNRRRAVLILAVIVALGVPAALLGPAAADAGRFRTRRVTKSYAVSVSCSFTTGDGVCAPSYRQLVTTSKLFKLEFVANSAHCTPIAVDFEALVGGTGASSGWIVVNPGESTGVVDLGPKSGAGLTQVDVWAKDAPGGSGSCADGPLSAWEGTLTVTTSKRVRR